jgi:hypothetical protein
MADHTDRLTPLELAEIRRRAERLPGDVTCLLSEVEALREHIAEQRKAMEKQRLRLQREINDWTFRAGYARGALARLVAEVPTGELRNKVAAMVADVDRELYPDTQEGGRTDG